MQAPWTPAFSWLDVKLGMRMMRKYPGVSLSVVFALAIGIPVSLLPNHLAESALGQSPPFDEGERVVGVGQDGRAELRVGDYEILRQRVRTFASLGAVIPTEVNVVSGDGWSEGEAAALMTATVFTLARVQPIMGRPLLAADEVPGAADVAVVGHSFWRRRLGGAHNVVGTNYGRPLRDSRQRERDKLRGVLLPANCKHHVLLATVHVRHRSACRSRLELGRPQ